MSKQAKRPVPKTRRTPTMRVADIEIGKRHRRDFGDIAALAQSINDRGGLLQPVVVTSSGRLIAGERRIKAWAQSRFAKQPIPVCVIDIDSIVAGEWDENAIRKNFTYSESVEIMHALLPAERAAAAARQKAARSRNGDKTKSAGTNNRALDKIGRVVGADRKSLAKAAEVVEYAKKDPTRFGKLRDDMDRTDSVNGPWKRLKVMLQSDEIKKEPPALPNKGPYRVFVCDFPWKAEENDERPTSESGRAFYPYPTMTPEQGVKMGPKVKALAHRDAVLLFWITNYHLARGLHLKIVKAMGFDPKTIVTMPKKQMGQGQLVRGKTEQVVFCTRGKPTITLTNQTSLLDPADRGEHSEKPGWFYDWVESLCPASRYAELFSRAASRPNWDMHGDQVGKLAKPEARKRGAA